MNVSGLGSVDLDALFLDRKIMVNVVGCSIWAELKGKKWGEGNPLHFSATGTLWCRMHGGAGALFSPVWNQSLHMLLKSHSRFLLIQAVLFHLSFLQMFFYHLRKREGFGGF